MTKYSIILYVFGQNRSYYNTEVDLRPNCIYVSDYKILCVRLPSVQYEVF